MSGMAQISVSLATWKAIEAQRLSFEEDHDAIIRRALVARTHQKKAIARAVAAPQPVAQRKRGNMAVDVAGRITPVANLKDAYVTILSQLVKTRPSLFQMLLKEGNERRRWIAMSPDALFPLSPHLARQFAHRIARDWYVDVNVSKTQIETRLIKACEIAGHRFGDDVTISGG
jgi:hypothetical protein